MVFALFPHHPLSRMNNLAQIVSGILFAKILGSEVTLISEWSQFIGG